MVTVDYPWLPPKCAICNSWGHKSEDCAQAKTASILTKQQGTVIHNEIPEKLAKSAAVSGESKAGSGGGIESTLGLGKDKCATSCNR